MAEESKFVDTVYTLAQKFLKPPLEIRRGSALLYQVTVDNNLALTVDPKRPMRGDSAFQTDLCIFERKTADIVIPRVVMEFKVKVSTHDVITYSVKARRHKQVYPYLRYGLVVSNESSVPGRFFVHNESLDFFFAMKGFNDAAVSASLSTILQAEAETSRRLEKIAFGNLRPRMFRTSIEALEEW